MGIPETCYPNHYEITDNAMAVLKARYLFRDGKTGEVKEKPHEMFFRVANTIAKAEKKSQVKFWTHKFYDLMAGGFFMPNSPTLLNAGRDNMSVLSGCYVFDVNDTTNDTIDSIFGSINLMAKIHKMGGGTGCNFSKLRAINSRVSSTGHVASGPVSFMRNYDEAIESIQQGGMRRGAHMSLLNVHHKDIRLFIDCKNELNERTTIILNHIQHALNLDMDGEFYNAIKHALIRSQLTNMNISVMITKEFKEALKNGGKIKQYNINTGEVIGETDAMEIFDRICYNAWRTGEPGYIDFDEINKNNPCAHLGIIFLVNPCGEQPLRPYESCNLGSLALPRFLKKVGKRQYELDWEMLYEAIEIAVRFLDDVIDIQKSPHELIDKATKETRKIGLGVMGLADYLIMLEMPYESNAALLHIEDVMDKIDAHAMLYSQSLGGDKGNFPAWKGSSYHKNKTPMRNALRTTIAPTGTIAGIAGVSSGIEPLFALEYTRTILDGKKFTETNKVVQNKLKEMHLWNSEVQKYISDNGTLKDCPFIPKKYLPIFKISHEISPEGHLKMQAAFQRHVNNAVSKTINLPESATVEDVKKIFLMAMDMNLKGITVYRDGSRDFQVLSFNKKIRKSSIRQVRKRPEALSGKTYERTVGTCGKLYITINTDDKDYPFEIFISAGKAGGCMHAQIEAIARLISIAWRSGLGIETIIKQLIGITCQEGKRSINEKATNLSCADVIARVIKQHFDTVEKIEVTAKEENKRMKCTQKDCSGFIRYEGKCGTCDTCFVNTCG